MKCDIRNCEQEAMYMITTKMKTNEFVCSNHLKSIIDGLEKIQMRRFVGIQSIGGDRLNGIVQKA